MVAEQLEDAPRRVPADIRRRVPQAADDSAHERAFELLIFVSEAAQHAPANLGIRVDKCEGEALSRVVLSDAELADADLLGCEGGTAPDDHVFAVEVLENELEAGVAHASQRKRGRLAQRRGGVAQDPAQLAEGLIVDAPEAVQGLPEEGPVAIQGAQPAFDIEPVDVRGLGHVNHAGANVGHQVRDADASRRAPRARHRPRDRVQPARQHDGARAQRRVVLTRNGTQDHATMP